MSKRFEQSYTYDDFSLYTRDISTLNSRFSNEISLKQRIVFDKKEFDIGFLMSAPMYDVTSLNLSKFLMKEKQIPILHRFKENNLLIKDIVQGIQNLKDDEIFGFSISVNSEFFLRSLYENLILDISYENPINLLICVDTANGATTSILKTIEHYNWFKLNLKQIFPKACIELMVGNISTKQHFQFLYNHGVRFFRCGISSGSVCSTSIVTGYYRGMFNIIDEIDIYRKHNEINDTYIVCDGGIKTSSDVLKALKFGSDFVMMGGLFAGFAESGEDEPFPNQSTGKWMKYYRGMASFFAADLNNKITGQNKPIVAEGIEASIEYKGEIQQWFDEFKNQLKTSFSLFNARNVEQFKDNSILTLLSDACKIQRKPHI